MEFTLGPLIGIALATMFFGYFFGLFEGRAQGYRRRQKEEPWDRQASVAAGKSAPEPPSAPAAVPPAPANAWLRLYADREGRPSLDLDGKRVDTSRLTLEQHQRLVQLMVVIRPWVESGAQAAGPQSVPASAGAAARPSLEQGGGFADLRTASPGTKLPAGVTVLSATPVPADPSAPTSMVAQIDLILQARLEGTALASRGIRLAESRDGGVLVFVGQQSYPGISDVPDPEVQTAIRGAISDWERRYTPG
jgi:hypothetical protein